MTIEKIIGIAVLATMLAVPTARAAEDSAADRVVAGELVRAAGISASLAIYERIAACELAPGVTVAQFLKQIGRERQFADLLHQAEQVGAPRWLDDNTCQVQMQISSVKVSEALQRLAVEAGSASPVTGDQIARAAAGWPVYFTATGSVISVRDALRAKPAMTGRWALVSDAARWKALAAATEDAARSALENMRTVKVTDRHVLGDYLNDPKVAQTLRQWLVGQPVGRIEFHDNLEVEIVLAVSRQDLFAKVREAIGAAAGMPLPDGEQQWQQVERDFAARFAPPTGRAKAVADMSQPAAEPAALAPRVEPAWVDEEIEAVGMAAYSHSRLKTARAAEVDAMNKLKARMEALPLESEARTVGAAAARSPRIAAAIEEALQRARIAQTDYRSDGTVRVRLSLSLRHLWEAMQSQ